MHAHSHDHEHSHGQSSYVIEQLCTVGVCGAYVIVLAVLFVKTRWAVDQRTLLSVVAPWIQWTVLLGCKVLFWVTLIRFVGIWFSSGSKNNHGHSHAHSEHEHAHGEHCDHDHGECGHEHHHHHEHEHHIGHAHVHHHDHHHDHGHDHDWSPWRYAVMVFPLVLFFLPIDWDQKIRAFENDLIVRRGGQPPKYTISIGPGEAACGLGTFSSGASGLTAVGALQYAIGSALDQAEQEAPGEPDARTDIGVLEKLATGAPDQQEQWKRYRRVEIQGMFSPADKSGRLFQIVRLRMACCLSDARPAVVLGLSRKPVQVASSTWLTVQGRVEFTRLPDGKAYPVLKVISVKPSNPPANPYLAS